VTFKISEHGLISVRGAPKGLKNSAAAVMLKLDRRDEALNEYKSILETSMKLAYPHPALLFQLRRLFLPSELHATLAPYEASDGDMVDANRALAKKPSAKRKAEAEEEHELGDDSLPDLRSYPFAISLFKLAKLAGITVTIEAEDMDAGVDALKFSKGGESVRFASEDERYDLAVADVYRSLKKMDGVASVKKKMESIDGELKRLGAKRARCEASVKEACAIAASVFDRIREVEAEEEKAVADEEEAEHVEEAADPSADFELPDGETAEPFVDLVAEATRL